MSKTTHCESCGQLTAAKSGVCHECRGERVHYLPTPAEIAYLKAVIREENDAKMARGVFQSDRMPRVYPVPSGLLQPDRERF